MKNTSILAAAPSGKPPERWYGVLDLAISEIPLVTKQLDYAIGDRLKKDSQLPYPSRLVKGEGSFRFSTGSPCGDQALGKLLYRRIADALPTLPGTMTAVHLGKRHIHQAQDDLLDWMCAKLLDGRPSALAVLVTPQGIQWYQLTPAGPDAQQLTPELIPCTESQTESLLMFPRLAAYECHRRRSSLPGMTFFRI